MARQTVGVDVDNHGEMSRDHHWSLIKCVAGGNGEVAKFTVRKLFCIGIYVVEVASSSPILFSCVTFFFSHDTVVCTFLFNFLQEPYKLLLKCTTQSRLCSWEGNH